jgi:uncharacterized membrane protein
MARPNRPSAIAFQEALWPLFLVFTAVGFAVMPFGIGEAQLGAWLPAGPAREALGLFLGASDAIWITLAAANVYFWAAKAEGLPTARRWAAIVLAGSAVLEWVGATTGQPFGPYVYTDRMGARIGGVLPFTIPLAWFVVVVCGRALVLRFFPKANVWQLAAGTGLAALATDFNLEYVAYGVRAYWIWYPGRTDLGPEPPAQNYVAWFAFAALFAALLREGRVASPGRRYGRPIAVLVLMNALFGATQLVQRWLPGA